jgi:hypothetical protein
MGTTRYRRPGRTNRNCYGELECRGHLYIEASDGDEAATKPKADKAGKDAKSPAPKGHSASGTAGGNAAGGAAGGGLFYFTFPLKSPLVGV